MSAAGRLRDTRSIIVVSGVLVVVVLALPQVLDAFWTRRITLWIPLALAALGLNLLTGYNGQISVGHGALYGVGAYSTALILNEWKWPQLAAIAASAVICFVAGVAVGLPALRIKGLYLALVTLAVATLFPQVLEQFSGTTGGSAGLAITNQEMNRRGVLADRAIRVEAPTWTGLADDQWAYYVFLAVAALCFLVVRNLVRSRVGRSMIAIRDNEVAAEVSGVNVAIVKVLTFGVSAALAGVGGAIFAILQARVSSGSFTLVASLYFLVAVVVGGSASIAGPAIGAVAIGLFQDVVTPALPESVTPWDLNAKAATPLILGTMLILLMLAAPGGIVGSARQLRARLAVRAQRPADGPISTPTTGGTP